MATELLKQRAGRVVVTHRGTIGSIVLTTAVVLLVGYPVFWLLGGPALAKGTLVANLHQALSNPRVVGTLFNSVVASMGTMVVSAVVGVPLAFFVSRTDLPLSGLIRNLTAVSYVTPSFLLTFAYVLLMGPNAGFLNRIVAALTGARPFNIYTMGGLIFVASLEGVPLVFLMTSAALGGMDGNLENAARILGARSGRLVVTITLPIVLPAIGAGMLLAFISTLSLYGAPAILGIRVIPTEIAAAVVGSPPQFERAAALAIYLIIVSLLGFSIYLRALGGQASHATITGKWAPSERLALGPWKLPVTLFCLLYVALATLLPYSMLGFGSVARAVGVGFHLRNLTWSNYQFIFSDPFSIRSIKNSLVLAAGAGSIGTFLGFAIAYSEVRDDSFRGRRLLQYAAIFPFGVPSIVLGVGLLLAFIRPPMVLYGTMWILLLAYVIKYMPLAVRTCSSSLRQVDGSLEEASRIVGGSVLATFRKVTLPLVSPGLVAGLFLIFIPSFRELGASILLVAPNTETVAFAMMTSWGSVSFEVTCALGVITLAMTFGVYFALLGPTRVSRGAL